MPVRLSDLPRYTTATVQRVEAAYNHDAIAQRLADLGFVPQERVCVLRRSWWKKGALVVQVGNATFALRHSEAACIELVP